MSERDPVLKAWQVLRLIIESGGGSWGVRQLANELGMAVSTTHRALASLQSVGVLRQDPGSGLYEVDLELLRLAHQVLEAFPLTRIAHPFLTELSEQTGETSLLVQYDPGRRQLMFSSQVEGTQPLRYVVPLHSWVPIHQGASGLAVFAFLNVDERERLLNKLDAAQAHDDKPRDRASRLQSLRAEFDRIRERGYAISFGQRIAGAVGVSAPVFQAGDEVIGAAMLTIPEARFVEEHAEDMGALVRKCAAGISDALGATRTPNSP